MFNPFIANTILVWHGICAHRNAFQKLLSHFGMELLMFGIASRALACGLLFTGMAAMPAVALPVTVTDVGVNQPQIITITGPVDVTAYVGQIVLTTSLGTLAVWCIDVFHDIGLGFQDLSYVTGEIANDFNGNQLSAEQISEIAGLVVHGDALLANGGTSSDSAATQLAIWSIEYPSFGYNGASSTTISETNALIAMAPSLVGSANALISLDGTQSFAVDPIPEPASLSVLAAGIMALGSIGRRHR
jgi:hypothetical protein